MPLSSALHSFCVVYPAAAKRGEPPSSAAPTGRIDRQAWCKIELHFHDPQTGHSYVALSSLELGTEPNVRACMRQDFHIGRDGGLRKAGRGAMGPWHWHDQQGRQDAQGPLNYLSSLVKPT